MGFVDCRVQFRRGIMRRPTVRRAVIVLLTALATLAGCSKKSTPPNVVPGYGVVLYSSPWLRILNSETLATIDSIPVSASVNMMLANPGQNEIITLVSAPAVPSTAIIVYDASSGDEIARRYASGTLSVLEVGKRLLLSRFDSLLVLDLKTLATIDSDTALVWDGKVTPGGTLVAGDYPSPPPPNLTGISAFYDLKTGWFDTLMLPAGAFAYEAEPHPDGRHCLIRASLGIGYQRLYVGDVENRTTTDIAQLPPFNAYFRVAFSPSGETTYVAVSQDPGDPEVIGCSKGEILIVWTPPGEGAELLHRLQFASPVYDVAMSPTGATFYVAVGWDRCSGQDYGGYLAAFDPKTLSVIDSVTGFNWPYHVEIGPELAN